MGHSFQVTVDCAAPHPLADWWAETLGWTVEPSDEAFIRSMIEQGHATEADTTTHHGTLVWASGAAIHATDGLPCAPRVLFQQVPEAKTVKNRVHLDVRLGPDGDVAAATRSALEQRGATYLHTASQGPHTWVTMTDPEGNEFCVSR